MNKRNAKKYREQKKNVRGAHRQPNEARAEREDCRPGRLPDGSRRQEHHRPVSELPYRGLTPLSDSTRLDYLLRVLVDTWSESILRGSTILLPMVTVLTGSDNSDILALRITDEIPQSDSARQAYMFNLGQYLNGRVPEGIVAAFISCETLVSKNGSAPLRMVLSGGLHVDGTDATLAQAMTRDSEGKPWVSAPHDFPYTLAPLLEPLLEGANCGGQPKNGGNDDRPSIHRERHRSK